MSLLFLDFLYFLLQTGSTDNSACSTDKVYPVDISIIFIIIKP